jgi:2-oxoglutarate dehydrogenase E2 component (dihydrolipoamide succinyltransferase)
MKMFNEMESALLNSSLNGHHDIIVPEDEQTEGTVTLTAWLKEPGDEVLAGEPVAELETDKVTVEIVSPVTGVLIEISRQVKDAVQPGDSVGRIRASDSVSEKPLNRPATAHCEPVTETGPMFVPHSAKHKIVAERVATSLRDAAHVTSLFEVDMSRIFADKDAYRQRGVTGPSYTAYILYAAVEALRTVPEINSRYHQDGLEILSDINLGVITAVDESDLVAPVLRNAQTLSFQALAERLQQLTEKARMGRLEREDVTDGTFTVSNHGVSGSLLAAPIVIYPPQVAVLGIGRIQKRPVVVTDGEHERIEIRPMAYITLTIDHRALNGARSNAYMTRLCEILENWPVANSESL